LRAIVRILAAAFGAILSAVAIFIFLNSSPAATPGQERLFSIVKGETVSQITDHLQSQKFIRFSPLLRLVSKVRGTEGLFRAGYYRIPSGSTTLAIHRLLVSGAQTLERVTIPEGWTARKIGVLLESKGICSASAFLAAAQSPELAARLGVPAKSLEGYLFPDTYFLPKPFSAEIFAEVMVKNFFQTLAAIAPQSSTMEAAALHDTVILASIVEREYRIAEEAPLIASVFKNRLKANIGLESCATLEYIITEIQLKAHPEYITLEDERLDSPYNTYKWAGLPPGPISEPGKVALNATFHAPRTDYLYFVLQDQESGRHYFSRDLKEHNQAKYLYLKK
jgi:UPF0755 protein